MPAGPDLRFDLEAKFAHLAHLGHRPDAPMGWHFIFRSRDLRRLTKIRRSLAKEFEVDLQESVEEITGRRRTVGPPMLTVVVRRALKLKQAKALAARFLKLAQVEGITYDGVSVYEPIDEEELFSWLDLQAATWRLRHFSDTGVPANAELPWVFAVRAKKRAVLKALAPELKKEGDSQVELVRGREAVLLVRCKGTNNEAQVIKRYRAIEHVVAKGGAEMVGVQLIEE